jgi:hypothetical protein
MGSASSTFIFTSCWVLLIFKAWWYQVVRCLLIEPFPESALNEQAGKMLLENYEEYARHARWAIPPLHLDFHVVVDGSRRTLFNSSNIMAFING